MTPPLCTCCDPRCNLRATLEDARKAVPAGSSWKHAKSGNVYVVVCVALVEADHGRHEPVVVYERDGMAWTRPVREFRERFEMVSAEVAP